MVKTRFFILAFLLRFLRDSDLLCLEASFEPILHLNLGAGIRFTIPPKPRVSSRCNGYLPQSIADISLISAYLKKNMFAISTSSASGQRLQDPAAAELRFHAFTAEPHVTSENVSGNKKKPCGTDTAPKHSALKQHKSRRAFHIERKPLFTLKYCELRKGPPPRGGGPFLVKSGYLEPVP